MKELPYFKFNVSEWLQGDITLSDFETQGLFVNICAYYWSKGGNIPYSTLKLRLSHAKATLFENLIKLNIIKINDKKDTINITFLDEQIAEREKNYKVLSDAGKKGADMKRIKNQTIEDEATLKPPLSQAETTHKQLDKEEDKDKNKKKIIEIPTFEDFKIYAIENKPEVCIKSLQLKYQSWVENEWKDGNNKKIVNWKSKLLNTLPYINGTNKPNSQTHDRNIPRTDYSEGVGL